MGILRSVWQDGNEKRDTRKRESVWMPMGRWAFVLVLASVLAGAWFAGGSSRVTAAGPISRVVTSTADTDGPCITPTTCTLRQAVNDSNNNDPGAGNQNTITFNLPSGARTITLTNGTLTLSANVAITGPTTRAVTVTPGNGTDDAFDVSGGVQATMSALTISGSRIGILTNAGGTVAVTASTFAGNGFAGIVNDSGTVTVTNSTLARNIVDGIFISGGTLIVTNSTITGNNTGVAIAAGTVNLANDIVTGNTTNINNAGGTVNDQGHNLTSGNALLGTLGDYGGPTQTIPLLPGSPALDTGACTLLTDQRGIARPQPTGGSCDIGAFEDNPTTVVNSTADGAADLTRCFGGNGNTCRLRDAIAVVNQGLVPSTPTPTITFALPGGAQTITLTSGTITLQSSVAIVGPTTSAVTVTTGNPIYFAFFVNSGVPAAFTNLTITDSGIYNTGGTVTVSNGTFTDNYNGVYANGGTTTVTNSTFTSNGGGILITAGMVLVTNSTSTGNTNGIYVISGTVNLANSIVTANTTNINNVGGAVNDQGHNLTSGNTLLGTLGSYGGPTQTIPLLPGSPAIGQVPSGCLATDQRGVPRPQSGCDIGAFESQGFSLTPVVGSTPQSTVVNTAFTNPLAVTVTANSSGEPVIGGQVTFTSVPGMNGQSASLTSSPATIGANGQASVSANANGTKGEYTVTASAAGTASLTFTLTNTAPLVSIAVMPANATLKVGAVQQYTATGTYADNATADLTSQVVWSPATGAVATVDGSGKVTGKSPGMVTITAMQGSVSGQTSVTVSSGSTVGIAPAPANRPGSAGEAPPGGSTSVPAPNPVPTRR